MATKKKTTKKSEKNTAKNTAKKNGTIRSSKFKNGKRTHKKCSVCEKWQPVAKFYRPERDCRCKDCSSTYAKQLREQKQKEEVAAKRKKNKKKAA